MFTSNVRPCARREPLFDIHLRTGTSIEVFYADRAGNVRFWWCWLVLVAAPTWLRAGGATCWSVRHELRSVSPCYEYGGPHPLLTMLNGCARRHHTDQEELIVTGDHMLLLEP